MAILAFDAREMGWPDMASIPCALKVRHHGLKGTVKRVGVDADGLNQRADRLMASNRAQGVQEGRLPPGRSFLLLHATRTRTQVQYKVVLAQLAAFLRSGDFPRNTAAARRIGHEYAVPAG